MGIYAPVILFVYNRPEYTEKTLQYLKNNDLARKSNLYIFSDAAKSENQKQKVNQVRYIIRRVDGFKSVKVVEAEKNNGLAKSIINGVSDIIKQYGKVIVLEDDILTSKCFLKFMNDALDYYQDKENVWSISGYKFPFTIPKSYTTSVFYAFRSSSWGWATWADRWNTIDWEIKDYNSYRYNPVKIARFCRGGIDLDKMLRNQMQGKIDSWAIRWCYNQSVQDRYTVYPIRSLVTNIGTDGSGTHCDPPSARFQTKIDDEFQYSFDADIEVNPEIMKRFRSIVNPSVLRKIKRIIHIQ